MTLTRTQHASPCALPSLLTATSYTTISTALLCRHLLNLYHLYLADVLPSALDISSGTATNSIYPNFYPSDVIEDPPPTSTYPYFLFPSKKYPPSAFQPALYSGADYINVPAGNTNQSLPHHHRSSYHPSSPADPRHHDASSTAPHQPPAPPTHSSSHNKHNNFDSTDSTSHYLHPNQHGKHQHQQPTAPTSGSGDTNHSAGLVPWSGFDVAPDLRQRLDGENST